MAAGARLAAAAGADVIDLNFGCPAREVTDGALAGSALMREPELLFRLIEAVVDAVDIPVTIKMRLGWDDASRNAPAIAAGAEARGVRAITVHGRTRCQFYKGQADWTAVAEVKAVRVKVIPHHRVGHNLTTTMTWMEIQSQSTARPMTFLSQTSMTSLVVSCHPRKPRK
jgi:tRNA-dihydrouridine synthase